MIAVNPVGFNQIFIVLCTKLGSKGEERENVFARKVLREQRCNLSEGEHIKISQTISQDRGDCFEFSSSDNLRGCSSRALQDRIGGEQGRHLRQMDQHIFRAR